MMKHYLTDFAEMIRLCETNFAQLCRLLPKSQNDRASDTVTYQVNSASYTVTILESTRYTILV